MEEKSFDLGKEYYWIDIGHKRMDENFLFWRKRKM
jgi:hypothetical protein